MSLKVGELYAALALDKSKFSKALKDGEKESHSFGGKVGGAFKTAAKVAVVALAAVAAAVIGIAKEAVDASKAHSVAVRAVTQAYGDAGKAVDAWAKKNAVDLGVTSTELDKSLGAYGIWAKNVGMSTQDAITSGEALAKRAAEISAATGKPFDEVFAALQKGAQGATKGLKTFGVAIDPVTIKAQALKMGLWSGKGAIDMHAKALATEAIILQQTTSYAAAAAAAHSSLGFQTKQAGVVIDEAFVSIGDIIVPLISIVLTGLMPAFRGFGEWVTANAEGIKSAVSGTFSVIGAAMGFVSDVVIPALVVAFNVFVQDVLPVLIAAFDYISKTVVPELSAAFKWVIENVLPPVMAGLDVLAKNVLPALADMVEFFSKQVLPRLSAAFDWVIKNVLPIVAAAIENIAKIVIPILVAVVTQFTHDVLPALGAAFEWIVENVLPKVEAAIDWITKNVLPPLGTAIDWIVKNVIPPLVDVFNWLATNVIPILATAIGFLTDTVIPALGNAFGFVAKVIGGVWDGITSTIKGAINLVISIINGMIQGLNSIQIHIPAIGVGPVQTPAFDWNGLGIGTIPMLAKGTPFFRGGLAIIGDRGPELVNLPRGAAVTPIGAGSSPLGGVTIGDINVYGATDPQATARAVLQSLRRELTRQGMSLA